MREDAVLLGIFKQKGRSDRKTGLSVVDGGLAVATVVRERGQPPRLLNCAFREENESPDRGLDALCTEYDLEKNACATVMPEESYQLLLVEAPDVDPSELRAAVRWRIKDLIGFHIDDAVIDVFEIPGQKGGNRMMYTVAARTEAVQQRVDLVDESDLSLEVIDIPEMCLRNVANLLPEDKRGLATLVLGDDHGHILLTRNNTLYLARRVDVGAVPLAAAEPAAREEMIQTIILEIQRSMDYYESHFSQGSISTIAVAPTESDIPELGQQLGNNLDARIIEIDLNELIRIEGETALDRTLQARCLTAVGAALRSEEVAL